VTLKELRKPIFAKQTDFAKALNTSEATVCDWEKGVRTPSVKQIVQIAEILNVSRYEVFDIFANKNGRH